MKEVHAANGEWKFHKSIPYDEIKKIVDHWRSAPDGNRYHFISIRKNNDSDAYRIYVVYSLENNSQMAYDKWFYRVIEDLIKRFGRDRTEKSFRCPIGVSWGISAYMTVVKQKKIQ